VKLAGYEVFLITIKALDASRRSRLQRGRQGATTEAYGAIRRKEERSLARLWREGNAADDALMVDQGRLYNLDLSLVLHYSRLCMSLNSDDFPMGRTELPRFL